MRRIIETIVENKTSQSSIFTHLLTILILYFRNERSPSCVVYCNICLSPHYCDDAQFDLSTAVHESTHFISSEIDAFPLVGGGAVERPPCRPTLDCAARTA